jgi:periplasmic divalent cation tolerance protein
VNDQGDLCEVIITAPDAGWLVEFTRSLVIERLCASGHNFTEIRSLYRWRGQVYDRPEARVALHTRRSLAAQIVARTLKEHPYEVPCVASVPIGDGSPEYLQWVRDETRSPD